MYAKVDIPKKINAQMMLLYSKFEIDSISVDIKVTANNTNQKNKKIATGKYNLIVTLTIVHSISLWN